MNDLQEYESYPLSPLQEGMLFHALANIGSAVDIEQIIFTLHETIDAVLFQRAWSRVVERHAVLRTRFEWEDTEDPRQVVIPGVSVNLEFFDWKDIAESEQKERLENYIQMDRAQEFNLNQALLMRLALFKLGNEEYKCVWTFHHILLDGRAFPLVLEEVFTFYEAFVEGRDARLDHPRLYRDYISWVRERELSDDERFWREHLEGFTTPTPLVVDAPLSAGKRDMGEEGALEIRIPEPLTSTLRHLASNHRLSMNTLVEGAWALLLARYNDGEDILYGTTRSCRRVSIESAESMIGLLINTVPVRIKISKQMKLIDWLKVLRVHHTKMREHIHPPLYAIQGWSSLIHGSPLFESLVVFENYFLNSYMQSKGGKWANRQFEYRGRTNYPLVLVGYDDIEMVLRIEFDEGRFAKDAVERMMGHLQTILQSIPEHLESNISQIPILTALERNQLLVVWNETQTEYPRDKCIQELFKAQALRIPDAVAVIFENRQMTYGELDRRSNQLARYLRKLGVEPEMLVGICVERSLEMVVGLLGILKAGGGYVPLDPAFPKERLDFMLSDTRISVLLTQQKLARVISALDTETVYLDSDWDAIAGENDQDVTPHGVTAESLAYVMYTSGSTGTPKGIEVIHRGVVRLVVQTNYARLDGNETFLQLAPISFDASTLELWAALLNGATCIVYPAEALSTDKLGDIIRRHAVSTLWLTASLFNAVIDEDPQALQGVSQLLIGGEQLSVTHVRRAQERLPGTQIINGYGPTENTTFTCCYSIPPGLHPDTKSIPIGHPIANTQVYVLDKHLEPVPVGVPGELHTGGDGLAWGYLNRPDLTRDKFIVNPFSTQASARLYKTGDLVQYCPDGNIEFLGRIDQQVKIRGFRIELGEIESVLEQHQSVREAVVTAREEGPGGKRLVAYIIPDGAQPPSASELRGYLREKLPEYMVPTAFLMLDKFPLTPSGKADRRALPSPEQARTEFEETYVAPQTDVERSLAEIWTDVLGVKRVGIYDNFFELGGNSLLAVKLFVRIRKWAGIDLPLAVLFRSPSVEALAKLIEPKTCGTPSISGDSMPMPTSATEQWRSLVHLKPKGSRPPFFVVHAVGGNVLNYLPLLCHTGADQPVYGLQARGLDGVLSTYGSIEEMAGGYIAEMRSVQPCGPYFVGGASFGGTVALEIAQQLTRAGEKVGLVVLFDSVGPGAYGYRYWRGSVGMRLTKIQDIANTEKIPFPVYLLKRAIGSLSNRMSILMCVCCRLVQRPIPLELREVYLVRNHNGILMRYIPRPYCGPIILFRGPAGEKWPYNDPELGWKEIAKGDLRIKTIAAPHLEFMEPPELGIQFAQELKEAQEKATRTIDHLNAN